MVKGGEIKRSKTASSIKKTLKPMEVSANASCYGLENELSLGHSLQWLLLILEAARSAPPSPNTQSSPGLPATLNKNCAGDK